MPTYRDPRGRWRYRGIYDGIAFSGSSPKGDNTERAAAALEKRHIRRLEGGIDPPLMHVWLDEYLVYQKPRTKQLTYKSQVSICAMLKKHLGHHRIDNIGQREIDTMTSRWLADEIEPSTVNSRLRILKGIFSLAVKHKRLAKAPAFGLMKLAKRAPRFLSDAECDALFAAAEPEWRSMIVVAARTGLRIGELRALRWGDIGGRYVRVVRTDPGIGAMDANAPKSGKERTVPLSSDANDALLGRHFDDCTASVTRSGAGVRESQLAEQSSTASGLKQADARRDVHESTETKGPGYLKALVWPATGLRGRNRTRSTGACDAALKRACELAGIVDCGWHTLRHTFASHLVMRGVPLRVVQEWLGHASIKMTECYSHLSPGLDYSSYVNSLDRPLGTKLLTDGDDK